MKFVQSYSRLKLYRLIKALIVNASSALAVKSEVSVMKKNNAIHDHRQCHPLNYSLWAYMLHYLHTWLRLVHLKSVTYALASLHSSVERY